MIRWRSSPLWNHAPVKIVFELIKVPPHKNFHFSDFVLLLLIITAFLYFYCKKKKIICEQSNLFQSFISPWKFPSSHSWGIVIRIMNKTSRNELLSTIFNRIGSFCDVVTVGAIQLDHQYDHQQLHDLQLELHNYCLVHQNVQLKSRITPPTKTIWHQLKNWTEMYTF